MHIKEEWYRGFVGIIETAVGVSIYTTLLLGIIGLSLVDMTLGTLTVGMVISANPVMVYGFDVTWFIAGGVSAATSAVQIVLFDYLLNTKRNKKNVVTQAWVGVAVLLSLYDTLIFDVPIVAYLAYKTNPLDFPPHNASVMFWAITVFIGLLVSMSELLTTGIIQIVRASTLPEKQKKPVQKQMPLQQSMYHSARYQSTTKYR